MPGTVEGREIALNILSGETERGWSEFLENYEDRLKRQARAMLRGAPALHSFGEEEDLFQAFFKDRVMERPDEMLGPTAHGVKPLWPRLSRSFTNYCYQILRDLARQRSADEAAAKLEAAPDSGGASERHERWTRIERRIRERQDTLREAFRSQEPRSVPLGHLLLLSERLSLARLIEMRLAEIDSRPFPELSIPERVSQMAWWTPEERERALPPKDRSLQGVWESLSQPALRGDGASIAQALGARRDLWDQWIRRARLRVIDHAGPDVCRVLFPHWPQGLTSGSGSPQNVGGGS